MSSPLTQISSNFLNIQREASCTSAVSEGNRWVLMMQEDSHDVPSCSEASHDCTSSLSAAGLGILDFEKPNAETVACRKAAGMNGKNKKASELEARKMLKLFMHLFKDLENQERIS
ncbi:hypothetical protein G6011_04170 [Alternaria panax]|uniref:Uncharacterized protein n=1 Tax=Alternaria panax TaxID=48097 RepID=A0AAD4IGN3_9PLEO|nr:hypothetical protein G6011_04170 [Alternaria panax]